MKWMLIVSGLLAACAAFALLRAWAGKGKSNKGEVSLMALSLIHIFTLHVNGSARMGQERFGESWGVIFEERIPEFLVAVGRKVADAGLSFEEWLPAHEAELRTLAEGYLV